MNTTIDLKTAKTIEAMNQKINHIRCTAGSGYSF